MSLRHQHLPKYSPHIKVIHRLSACRQSEKRRRICGKLHVYSGVVANSLDHTGRIEAILHFLYGILEATVGHSMRYPICLLEEFCGSSGRDFRHRNITANCTFAVLLGLSTSQRRLLSHWAKSSRSRLTAACQRD
jgi:hypothetical protein